MYSLGCRVGMFWFCCSLGVGCFNIIAYYVGFWLRCFDEMSLGCLIADLF